MLHILGDWSELNRQKCRSATCNLSSVQLEEQNMKRSDQPGPHGYNVYYWCGMEASFPLPMCFEGNTGSLQPSLLCVQRSRKDICDLFRDSVHAIVMFLSVLFLSWKIIYLQSSRLFHSLLQE